MTVQTAKNKHSKPIRETHNAQNIAGMLPGRTLDAVYSKRQRMKENSDPTSSASVSSNRTSPQMKTPELFPQLREWDTVYY